MRPSSLKHTVAILRHAVGPNELTQKELARLVGKSPVTIQKIEIGQLVMSESLAQEIVRQTGVSLAWLLKGDVSKPPVEEETGRPYTKESFEFTQSHLSAKLGLMDFFSIRWQISRQIKSYCRIGAAAAKAGKLKLFLYKVSRFLSEMRKEFLPESVEEISYPPDYMPAPLAGAERKHIERFVKESDSTVIEEDAAADIRKLWSNIKLKPSAQSSHAPRRRASR